MSTRKTLIGLAACAAIAAGCGEDSQDEPAKAAAKPSPAERQAQLERNPYGLRCADIRDEIESARMTRIVQYALADDADIPALNRLQSAQSIYYAITELCKSAPDTYRPADDAVAGVRSGTYRADLGTP